MLSREIFIYGKLTANDYLSGELYIWLYSGLIIITLLQLERTGVMSDIWNYESYRYRDVIRFKKTVFKFIIALVFLPLVFQYDHLAFLH